MLVCLTELSEVLKKKKKCTAFVNTLDLCGVHDYAPAPLLNALRPPPPQEAASVVALLLQSILRGSEGVNVTPNPVRNSIQDSKVGKPSVDCTYSTGKSGRNLWERRREMVRKGGFRFHVDQSSEPPPH